MKHQHETHGAGTDKHRPSLALAAGSDCAVAAARQVANLGGNAVDAAIAAVLVAATTEPGVAALGGGAYLTIWPQDGPPVTIDGNVEMPGRDGIPPAPDLDSVHMEYGGGVTTLVGNASIGTPGAIAACGRAREQFGKLPWQTLVQPAIDTVRSGFPLSMACWSYLQYSAKPIFSRSEEGRRALLTPAGEIKAAGARICLPELADSLEIIAREGPDSLYTGGLGRRIAADIIKSGGVLGATDLACYQAIVRDPVMVELNGWRIAGNPPPAAGGTSLAAMLLLLEKNAASGRDHRAILLDVQRKVIRLRKQMAGLVDPAPAAFAFLEKTARGISAPNTVHVSAVDKCGLACAVTWSAGYGSGLMPGGAGIWMNNCLGETELNQRGILSDPPGTRVPSNMAPTIARNENGSVITIGSPGAERITTALLYTLYYVIFESLPLAEAIEKPRAHVEKSTAGLAIACEPGATHDDTNLPLRRFDRPDMFFGGVTAAARLADGSLIAAADPRRTGATLVC
ncbi:MAG: gamma-glutamyltransferase [Gammaproteobacteria bacterium]|nr:gamma-glutamyltransferase [Gammaproteobacteria bacterium]